MMNGGLAMLPKKITFINEDTNTTIDVNLKTPFVVIYGRNGIGKTTFSKSREFDKRYVFNTDYIRRNVYIVSSEEAKADSSTKKSFSSLWFSEDIINAKKELDDLINNGNAIDTKFKSLVDEINADFSKNYLLGGSDQFARINGLLPSKYAKTSGKSDDDIEKDYKAEKKLATSIQDDSDLAEKVNTIKNNELCGLLLGNIEKDDIVKGILSKDTTKRDFFLQEINEYNSCYKEIVKIENSFTIANVNLERNWIEQALVLHADIDSCLFCGKDDIGKAKEKWDKIIKDKIALKKDGLLKEIKKHIDNLETILTNRDKYSKIAVQAIESLTTLLAYYSRVKGLIESTKPVGESVCFPDLKFDDLLTKANDIKDNCVNYIVNKKLDSYEILFLLKRDYKDKIDNSKKALKKLMDTSCGKITLQINEMLKKLDVDKELMIGIDNGGGESKFKFEFTDKSISIETLSDGQKHKLALAIFLSSIKELGIKDKTVVLDDPVVTLDQKTYYSIKSIIINLRKEQPECIVLLTYNISYLYVQLSNLFNDVSPDKDTTFYQLFSKHIECIDYNILNYDDLTLYQTAVKKITSREELSILASINLRMARYFLDMRLRLLGVPSTDNPGEEIKQLPNKDDITELSKINDSMTHIVKDSKSTGDMLYQTFVDLNSFLKLLGFPILLSSEDLKRIKSISSADVRIMIYKGDELIFKILSWAHYAINNRGLKYSNICDYVRHPRHQLTSTIIGIDFANEEVKASDFGF